MFARLRAARGSARGSAEPPPPLPPLQCNHGVMLPTQAAASWISPDPRPPPPPSPPPRAQGPDARPDARRRCSGRSRPRCRAWSRCRRPSRRTWLTSTSRPRPPRPAAPRAHRPAPADRRPVAAVRVCASAARCGSARWQRGLGAGAVHWRGRCGEGVEEARERSAMMVCPVCLSATKAGSTAGGRGRGGWEAFTTPVCTQVPASASCGGA